MNEYTNCYEFIEYYLKFGGKKWLATHEIGPMIRKEKFYSDTTIDRRLRELREQGIVRAQERKGENYNEWGLVAIVGSAKAQGELL